MTALQHISPAFRNDAERPSEERITLMRRGLWIPYPLAERAADEMQTLLDRPPNRRMSGLAIIGPYNNGKTMIVQRFAERAVKSKKQRGVVYMEAPAGGGQKNFFTSALAAFGAEVRVSSSLQIMRMHMKELAHCHRPRLLIVDEFHRVLSGQQRTVLEILAFFRQLGSEFDISTVFVGDARAGRVLFASDEMATRLDRIILPRWKFDTDFARLLKGLEAALPLKAPSDLVREEKAAKIFEMSEGLLGETVRLVVLAAVSAVRSGEERITSSALEALQERTLAAKTDDLGWEAAE